MKASFSATLLLATLLSGCVTDVAPVLLMPKTVDAVPSSLTENALLVGDVTLKEGGVDSYLNANNFRIALEETLKRSNIFGSNVDDQYVLTAHVLKAKFPGIGATMESTLNVHYVLASSSGEEVLSEDVAYTGVALWDEEFFGSARSLLAFQRTQQGHFSLLLQRIKEVLRSK